MKLTAAENNAVRAVEYLLADAKIKVSRKGLEEEFVLHPDFPSLAAVSDALTEWKVPNMAASLVERELVKIPTPALAYLRIRGGILAPIKSVSGESVEWLDTKNGWQKENLHSFAQKWTGAILLIEPNKESGELNYKDQRKGRFLTNSRLWILLLGTLFCLGFYALLHREQVESAIRLYGSTLFIKFFGIAVTTALLSLSIESENSLIRQVCQLGNSTDCNSVLASKGARITSWLSWSEIGFIYFSGGFLALLTSSIKNQPSILSFLFLLSVCSIPYTIYSFWYQRFVVNKWCTLCILVQIALWMEVLLTFLKLNELAWNFASSFYLTVLLSYLVPALGWVLVKKPLMYENQVVGLKRELQKIKLDENYIKATFTGQPEMPPIFAEMTVPWIGNTQSNNTLTVVTNPLCGPCVSIYLEIRELMAKFPDLRCQFIFIGPPRAMQVAAKFLETPQEQLLSTMDRFYEREHHNMERWTQLRKSELPNDLTTKQLLLNYRWSELAGIKETPTVFFNGVKLQKSIRLSDLRQISRVLNYMKANSFPV
jgi:uncharacterized membrane protein/protein-disulfide isomerase